MNRPVDIMMDAVEWTTAEGRADPDELLPYVTHRGMLHIGDMSIRCYQLNDGRRIIDAEDLKRFFGFAVDDGK